MAIDHPVAHAMQANQITERSCDVRFALMREAFAENLKDEIGAALVVRVEGVDVVDLSVGWADAARTRRWSPDTAHGYHVNTFGFMCGEIVRRATGERLSTRFAHLIGDEAGVSFGARPGADIAEFVFDTAGATSDTGSPAMSPERQFLLGRAYLNPPGLSGLGTVNTDAWRQAEIPSCNLHASARGLVRVMARIPELLNRDLLAEATRPWSDGRDFVLDRHTRFGLGFQLAQPDRSMGPGPRAYGHFGASGSLAFHDPDNDLTFAYVCNRCEGRRWQTTRTRHLLDALTTALRS
jgi:CubicO group peptidase (beta-lactamase class C family)